MATQIPRIERVEQSPTSAGTGRINLQAQSNASTIASRTASVNQVVNAGATLYQNVEDQKISNLSNEVEQEYTRWNNQELAKLKNIQGDPTEAYVQYDKAAKEKYDSLLASKPELNDRVRRHVTSHLDKVRNDQSYAALKQRGAQQETYENNLFESTVKLKRNNLAVNSGYIQSGNPGSYLPFDEGINDLKTTVAQRALKKGNAKLVTDDSTDFTHMYRDGDGNIVRVKMDPIAKQRLAQELSKGVADSIKSMSNAGYGQAAKETFERYKAYIDPRQKVTITNKFTKESNKAEAKRIFAETQGQSAEAQEKTVNSIKDPDVKLEYLKYKESIESRMETQRKRREKMSYNELSKFVNAKMNSDNPLGGLSELEDTQLYKELWDNLDSKSQQAIQEMIKSPKNSNQKSVLRVQDLFLSDNDEQLESMSSEDFQLALRGLNNADRRKYTNMYEQRLKRPTGSSQRAVFNRASKQLKDRLLLTGTIKRNDRGFFSKKDEKKLIKMQNDLIDYLGANVDNLNDKEIKTKIDEFTANQVKEDTGWFSSFFSGSSETTTVRTDTVQTQQAAPGRPQYEKIEDVPASEIIKFKREFRERFGRGVLKSDPAFIKFINTGN